MQKTEKNMSSDKYMRLAIAMAQKIPRYPFGAVIVRRTTGGYRQVLFRLPEVPLPAPGRSMSTIKKIHCNG
ncbi:MAG TPA: hypothetical protein DD706_11955 [Nitrospiraceae bacterium]|nr:hypothetical protein [Nitrospiraceae bacterium]